MTAPVNSAMWNAVLKWSLAQHDGTSDSSHVSAMSEEDRKFLSDAMESMVVDEIGEMRKIIATLKLPEEPEKLRQISDLLELKQMESESKEEVDDEALLQMIVNKKQTALEDLEDYVVGIDRAQDLHKIEGLAPLIQLLRSRFTPIRASAANVLGTVVQNNPKCQQWAFELQAVPGLLSSLDASPLDSKSSKDVKECISKNLYALSGLLRHFDPALVQFVAQKGQDRLLDILTNSAAAAAQNRKAIVVLEVLLKNKLTSTAAAEQALARQGLLDSLAGMIGNTEDITLRENVVRLLALLTGLNGEISCAITPTNMRTALSTNNPLHPTHNLSKPIYTHLNLTLVPGGDKVKTACGPRCEERLKEISVADEEDEEMLEDEKLALQELIKCFT